MEMVNNNSLEIIRKNNYFFKYKFLKSTCYAQES